MNTIAEAGESAREPFGPIFKYVANRASSWFGGQWPADMAVVIEALGRQPFPTKEFWVNAITSHRIENPSIPPTVHIRIYPEHLNFETFAAIFAVLVHEFVCHVPSTVQSSNSSTFAEGFCDWAAQHLFDRWLDDFDLRFRDAARQFGESIWALGKDRAGGNPLGKERRFGHLAAEHVVDVFRPDVGRIVAVNQTIDLARDLTLTDATALSKDNFVRGLGRVTEGTRQRLLLWRDREISAQDLLERRDHQ